MFDVKEVDRLGDPRPMIELAQIALQSGIVGDLPQIALEVAEIDRVEADQRREQAPVRLGQPLAAEEALVGEPRLEPIERLEQSAERLLIGGLGGGEAGAVDPVVDGRVDTRVERVDLGPEIRRIIVALGRAQAVESAVEHANDLRRFVADDRAGLSVP